MTLTRHRAINTKSEGYLTSTSTGTNANQIKGDSADSVNQSISPTVSNSTLINMQSQAQQGSNMPCFWKELPHVFVSGVRSAAHKII